MSRITFILGGARSGKSRHAEALAVKHRGAKTYIATAEAIDAEMQERIAGHRERRGEGWNTIEAPIDLVSAFHSTSFRRKPEPTAAMGPGFRRGDGTGGFILIDCVTVWIGNLMHHGRDVRAEVAALCAALKKTKARVVIVSNEVGLSIVPDNALARVFRDEQGFANQAIAAVADEVIFVAAGLPIILKKASRRPAPARTAKSGRGRKA